MSAKTAGSTGLTRHFDGSPAKNLTLPDIHFRHSVYGPAKFNPAWLNFEVEGLNV